MAIGGETVGHAYVMVHADGRGLDRDIKLMFDKTEPAVRQSAKKTGDDFTDEFFKTLNRRLRTEKDWFGKRFIGDRFEKLRAKLKESGDDWERYGDRIGRAFGKGGRNDFVNIVGRIIGGLSSLPGVAVRTLGKVIDMGNSLTRTFDEAGGGLRGFGAAARPVVTSLLTAAGGIGGLAIIVGTLTTALELAGGAVIALASSLSFALVGAVGVAAGAMVPLVAGIGTAIIAFVNMDKKAKQAFKGVKDAFGDLGDVAADEMFRNIGDSADKMESVVRGLTPLMRALAGAVRNVFDGWIEGVNSPEFDRFRDFLTATLPGMVESLGRIAGNVGQALANIWIVATPYVQTFLGWLEGVTESWARFTNTAAGQNKIATFFDHAADSLRRVWGFLDSVLELVGELFSAGRQTGDNIFKSMETAIRGWTQALREDPDILDRFFKDAEKFANALGHIVVEIGKFIGAMDTKTTREFAILLGETLANAFKTLSTLMKPVMATIDTLGPAWSGAAIGVLAFSNAISKVVTPLGFLVNNVGKLQAPLSRVTGPLGTVTSKLQAMPIALRGLTGAAGLVGVADGMRRAADEGLSFGGVLESVLGGAVTGATIGGLPGALIGGVGGGVLNLITSGFHDTEKAARKTRLELLKGEGYEEAKADAAQLAEALNGVVDAYGRVGRAAVESSFVDEEGNLERDVAQLREFGVSMDTITSAAMGNADAIDIVNRAWARMQTRTGNALADTKKLWDDAKDGAIQVGNQTIQLSNEQRDAYRDRYLEQKRMQEDQIAGEETFNDRIHENTTAIKEHRKDVRDLAQDLHMSVQQYKNFPKSVRTNFEERGLPETIDGVERLLDQYKGLRNFKSIKALISAPGVDVTTKKIKELGKQYGLTPEQIKTLVDAETKEADKNLDRTKKKVDDLDKSEADPNIKADTREADRNLDNTKGKMQTLNGMVSTAKLTVDNSGAQGAISQTEQWLNSIQDEKVYVDVERRYKGVQKYAAGGIVAAPTMISPWDMAGEAGVEAVVPLNKPLSQVDPSVRALSAFAQGMTDALVTKPAQRPIEITIVTPTKDPYAVALETVNRLAAVGY